jgi:hypothetical protein
MRQDDQQQIDAIAQALFAAFTNKTGARPVCWRGEIAQDPTVNAFGAVLTNAGLATIGEL